MVVALRLECSSSAGRERGQEESSRAGLERSALRGRTQNNAFILLQNERALSKCIGQARSEEGDEARVPHPEGKATSQSQKTMASSVALEV